MEVIIRKKFKESTDKIEELKNNEIIASGFKKVELAETPDTEKEQLGIDVNNNIVIVEYYQSGIEIDETNNRVIRNIEAIEHPIFRGEKDLSSLKQKIQEKIEQLKKILTLITLKQSKMEEK